MNETVSVPQERYDVSGHSSASRSFAFTTQPSVALLKSILVKLYVSADDSTHVLDAPESQTLHFKIDAVCVTKRTDPMRLSTFISLHKVPF